MGLRCCLIFDTSVIVQRLYNHVPLVIASGRKPRLVSYQLLKMLRTLVKFLIWLEGFETPPRAFAIIWIHPLVEKRVQKSRLAMVGCLHPTTIRTNTDFLL